MKYVIYQLVQPNQLNTIDESGYHPHIINRTVLQELDVPGVKAEHESFDGAVAEITLHAKDLKFMSLAVIPVISISYEGEIS